MIKANKNGKSDAGFKDALIWKTVLYSEELNNYDVVYFFSGDSIFETYKHEFVKQFEMKHSNTNLKIHFIQPDDGKIQECLKIIVNENNFPEADCVKLYDKSYILDFIKNIKYEGKGDVVLNSIQYDGKDVYLKCIEFNEFNVQDFIIDNIERNEQNFFVDIMVKTTKYKTNIEDTGTIDNRRIKGRIKLELSKDKKKFVLNNYKLNDIRFEETLQESIKKLSDNIQGLYNMEYIKNLTENLNRIVRPIIEAQETMIRYNLGLWNNDLNEDVDDNNNKKDEEEKG